MKTIRHLCKTGTIVALMVIFIIANSETVNVDAQGLVEYALGQILRFPLEDDPAQLNPIDLGSPSDKLVANQIFESFFRFKPDGFIEPAGAASYDVSPDGLIYTVHLRPEAVWSDGVPVTSQHYIDGMLALAGTPNENLLYPVQGFLGWSEGTIIDPDQVGLTAIDDYTLEITLDEEMAHFPYLLASPQVKFPIRLDLPEADRPFTSNGPFIIGVWEGGQYLTLIRNPDYWDVENVTLLGVYMPIIPDPADQFTAYANGELDVSGFSDDDLPGISADPIRSAELKRVPSSVMLFIGLNTARTPTDDLDLRIALASSVNRQQILDWAGSPWYLPTTGIIPPEMIGHQGSEVGYQYNLQLAQDHLNAYMASHGISDPAEIQLTGWSITGNEIPYLVFDEWRNKLEISVDIIEFTASDYFNLLEFCNNKPEHSSCEYNGYRLGYYFSEPRGFLYDSWHPEIGWDLIHLDNPYYWNLLADALVEYDDLARADLYKLAEKSLVEDDVGIIPITFINQAALIKPYVDYEFTQFGSIPDLMNWSIAPLVVTNTEDDGLGSLRQAVLSANERPWMDIIEFDIPPVECEVVTGICTIQPQSALPVITSPIIIDGYSQPGASPNTNPAGQGTNAQLKVELEGTFAGEDVSGLHITAGQSLVQGLVINRFQGDGIHLETPEATEIHIQGNFIGTDITGSLDLGNFGNGVTIRFGATDNLIGGSEPGAVNVISGNGDGGIGISEIGTTLNVVQGNLIGTDATGTKPLGNTFTGIFITDGPTNNRIAGNVISDNKASGVVLDGQWVSGNVVAGNYIGTDIDGIKALPNFIAGVWIVNGAANNTIGGTTAEARNIISGNIGTGISIVVEGPDYIAPSGNLIQGNYIGTDVTGSLSIGNIGTGVNINHSPENEVLFNTISFNGGEGVRVEGFTAVNNTISGNSIHANVYSGIENLDGGNGELQPPSIMEMHGDWIIGSAPANSIVEIYADSDGEGQTYLGNTIADPAGKFFYSDTLGGPNLTATATDAGGSTSEFSLAVPWVPDNCEINDTFDQACDVETVLNLAFTSPGSFESYISRPNDVDWFFLEIPETIKPGSQVTFALSGSSGSELPANFDLAILAELEVDPNTGASPLQGVPLQGVPLQGVPLQGVPLQGVDAVEVPLQGVPLQGVDVNEIPLQGVPLQGVPLQGVPLQGVPLQGVPLQGVGFHQGRQPEEISTLFRGGMTGKFFVMVWSSTGEFSTGLGNSPYEVTITFDEVAAEACLTAIDTNQVEDPLETPLGDTSDPQTLILINKPRMVNLYGLERTESLINDLSAAGFIDLVDGMVIDLGSFPAVREAYSYWDVNGCNPEAANLVTLEIKKVINDLLSGYPTIENLVLIGSDLVIPMRRVPDEIVRTSDGATVPNEYDYQFEQDDGTKTVGMIPTGNSPTFATLLLQYYLSDDFYADLAPVLLEHGHELSVPDMPIGRLVEKPEDIRAYIQAFIDRNGIMVAADSAVPSLTTGYSFLTDQAQAIDMIFNAKGFTPDVDLISDDWARDAFISAFTDEESHPAVSSINAHTDHWRLAPPIYEPLATTADPDFLSDHLPGTLLFSVGCHMGFNFVDQEAIDPAHIGAYDFPQALIHHGGTLIGNWGFGYADDAALAYSEELMTEFARNLGNSSIGHSMLLAKREYILNQAILDPVHEKVLMEAVLYGLPMWEVSLPTDSVPDGVAVETTPEPHDELTILAYDVEILPDQISQVTIPERGSYFSLAGRTQAALFRPIQPKASIDVSSDVGEVAHGVVFIGGTYHEIFTFDPAITMPSWTLTNPEPQFIYEGWDPPRFWSLSQLERLDGLLDERLVINPGQFQVDAAGTAATGITVGTERLYEDLQFEVVYASAADEFLPPIINYVNAWVNTDSGISVIAMVEDPETEEIESSEIVEVIITYTEKEGGSTWRSINMNKVDPSSGLWRLDLEVSETIDFFVQAVDEHGNVGMFAGNGYFTPVVVGINGPSTAAVGQTALFTAVVPDDLHDPTFLWDFGDGSKISGNFSVMHTFSEAGSFTVSVKVVDRWGNLGETQMEIYIEDTLDPSIHNVYNRLIYLISSIQELPDEALKNPADDRKHSLMVKFTEVGRLIFDGDYPSAINKLTKDILMKMDGCLPMADKNDWIIDCGAQGDLQNQIEGLIANIEALY